MIADPHGLLAASEMLDSIRTGMGNQKVLIVRQVP